MIKMVANSKAYKWVCGKLGLNQSACCLGLIPMEELHRSANEFLYLLSKMDCKRLSITYRPEYENHGVFGYSYYARILVKRYYL